MSFVFYGVAYLVFIAAVCYLAYLVHIPQPYIFAISLIMLGIGVATGVEDARQKHLN